MILRRIHMILNSMWLMWDRIVVISGYVLVNPDGISAILDRMFGHFGSDVGDVG